MLSPISHELKPNFVHGSNSNLLVTVALQKELLARLVVVVVVCEIQEQILTRLIVVVCDT